MEITFMSSNNEKFAYAYALEKAIKIISSQPQSQSIVAINVYGGVEEYCKKLSELRWLLEKSRNELEIELINERIKFRIIEDVLSDLVDSELAVQFHLFPSKMLETMADYVKFLLKLQAIKCHRCVLVDDIEVYERNCEESKKAEAVMIRNWVYGIFPPDSILTVTCHAASRQFEVQKWSDKGIIETIRMEWDNDRMNFS